MITDGWIIAAIVVGIAYSFLLGSIFGQRQERQWRLRMKHDREELEYCQREVDNLIEQCHRPTFERYDRVN